MGIGYSEYWGTLALKEEYIEMIDSIKFDDNSQVLVSKVMEMLNSRMTMKYSPYYNTSDNGFFKSKKKSVMYWRKEKS